MALVAPELGGAEDTPWAGFDTFRHFSTFNDITILNWASPSEKHPIILAICIYFNCCQVAGKTQPEIGIYRKKTQTYPMDAHIRTNSAYSMQLLTGGRGWHKSRLKAAATNAGKIRYPKDELTSPQLHLLIENTAHARQHHGSAAG